MKMAISNAPGSIVSHPGIALARDLRIGDEIRGTTGAEFEFSWRIYVIGFDGPDPHLMSLDKTGRVASMGIWPWYNFDAAGFVYGHRFGESAPEEETI